MSNSKEVREKREKKYASNAPGKHAPDKHAPGNYPRVPETLTLKEKLEEQINDGKIIFDPGKEESFKKELLRENTGTKVTVKLQELILELSELVSTKIRISSLIRTGTGSHHCKGRAVDIGNEEIADDLLPKVAKDDKVEELEIDELIFDAKYANETYDRNKWNYDRGKKHSYGSSILDTHWHHIHFAVKE